MQTIRTDLQDPNRMHSHIIEMFRRILDKRIHEVFPTHFRSWLWRFSCHATLGRMARKRAPCVVIFSTLKPSIAYDVRYALRQYDDLQELIVGADALLLPEDEAGSSLEVLHVCCHYKFQIFRIQFHDRYIILKT